MKNSIFRKLPASHLTTGGGTGLKRSLGAFELIMMGVGVTIGSGLFVITGVAAAEYAGPGLIFSFLLAGIACGCAGLCYAELASCMPAPGGAYTFVYAGLGELFAWFVGWCLTLEYVVALSAIAVGWSAYVSDILPALGLSMPGEMLAGPSRGGVWNIPASAIIFIMALVQMRGAKESARLNNILVTVKIAVIIAFILLVADRIDLNNYFPFLPYGWSGVYSGAAVVFFAYLGFDAIANSAGEVKSPQKNMPVGILASLAIVTFLYIAVTLVLTGVVKYNSYEGVAAPMAFALNEACIQWGASLVSAGAIAGLTTGVLVFIGSESRLLYAMARDGLLPEAFARIGAGGVPGRAVVCVCLAGSVLAGVLPIGTIAQLCNMGTLWAFFLVAVSVLILRKTQPALRRPFKVPAVPFIPLCAVVLCAFLALQLDGITWTAFGGWTVLGLCIYFLYKRHHHDFKS